MWNQDSPPTDAKPLSRVLVTGATGFIGQHLLSYLISHGIEVRTLGRRAAPSSRGRLDHRIADVRQDFRSAAEGCDVIVHLAGLSDASASYDRPVEFAEVNVIGTIRALEAARHAGIPIVFASTMRVYRPSVRPLSEDAPLSPVDPYGLSKLQAESWVESFNRLYGVRGTILRLFSVYGPGQVAGTASGVVSIFLRAAREGSPLRVRARQLRDFVDVRDVVNAIAIAATVPPESVRTVNVGTGQATTVQELGDLVRRVVGNPVPIIVDLTPGPESYVADMRRAAAELNFQAKIELADGIAWYNDQLDVARPVNG
jgi:UDP-glucose 4-epimerase